MAEADLDIVIRQIAKAQNKSLMAAVKKRRDQIMARAAKAKDKETRDQFRLIAKSTMLLGTAAAKRLQNSAENTADSYARAIRNAAEEAQRLPGSRSKKAVKKKEGYVSLRHSARTSSGGDRTAASRRMNRTAGPRGSVTRFASSP